jgi:vesicle-associated membrane protein 7
MSDAIIYSSVSQGTTVLAEFTSKAGNFMNVVQRILKNLPAHDNEVTYQYGDYYFDIVVKNEIVYLAMADKGISDIEVAHRFLKDIFPKFQQRYGESGQRCNAMTSKDFKNVLQDAMDYFSTGDARASKSREIQDELARTKGTMFKNIDQALQRGEKIDVLVDKTDTLAQQSGQFKRKATAIKRGYRCQNIKMMAICGGMIVTLLYVVISSSTGKWNPGQWFGGK